MEIEIRNECLRFRAGDLSGEHLSLRFIDEDAEYVWQPRPGHWERGSFVCFPLLGRLPGGSCLLDGQRYELPMHGFAQYRRFALTEQAPDRMTFTLLSDGETRAVYPFDFALRLRYALRGPALEIVYEVENRDARTLPFSIGGHPGFACPVLPGEEFSDYALEFDREERLSDVVTFYSPIEVLRAAFGDAGRVLPLSYELFRDGSVCFRPVRSEKVRLVSRKSGRGVELSLSGADCFQIWTAPGSPFLAMEAWHGAITRRDRENQDDWLAREGTIRLPPGERWQCRHTVTPLR
jgi:galactose mutarotase-like enzyme